MLKIPFQKLWKEPLLIPCRGTAPSSENRGLRLYLCGLDGFAKIDDTDLILFKEDNEFAKNERAVAIEGLTIKRVKDVLSIVID